MGWLTEAIKFIGDKTKRIEVPIGAEGVETPTPINALQSLKQSGVNVMCDAILQRLLSSEFGVDVSNSIPSSIISSNEKRIVDLRNILISIDIEGLYIKDGNEHVLVGDYIFNHFSIEDWDSYIDTIYQKMREGIYSPLRANTGIVYKFGDEFNEMVSTLAVILGTNPSCLHIPYDAQVVTQGTIDFSQSITSQIRDPILTVLKNRGYLSANSTLGAVYRNIDDFGSGTGYYSVVVLEARDPVYGKAWSPLIIFTKEPIAEVKVVQTYEHGIDVTSRPNYSLGYWGFSVDLSLWKEDNELYTDVVNICSVSKVFDFESTADIFDGEATNYTTWGDTQVTRDLTVDVCFFLSYEVDGETITPTSDITTNTIKTVILNGGYTINSYLNAPNIDAITESSLEDNNLKMVSSDTTDLFVFLGKSLMETVKGYIPTSTPYDTTHEVKVGTIKKSTKRLVDSDMKVTDFIKAQATTWLPLWKNKLLIADLEEPTHVGLCTQYYLKAEHLKYLAEALWSSSWWEGLFNRDPMEAILSHFALPFELSENVDYISKSYNPNYQIVQLYEDGTTPIMFGGTTAGNARGYALKRKRVHIGFHLKAITLFNNFTDYEPYTKASIWLPFIGTRTIDTSLIMNNDLEVIYTISLNTGDFEVKLISKNVIDMVDDVADNQKVREPMSTNDSDDGLDNPDALHDVYNNAPILVEYGNMAYQLAVSGKFSNAKEQIANGFQALCGIVTSNVMQTASGTLGLIGGIAGNAVQSKGLSGTDKWLGHPRPYITLFYHQPIDDMRVGTAFDETIGHKSSHGMRIGEMTKGFHKLKSVKMEGLTCTLEEQKMIEDTLMSGFYKGVEKKTNV